MAAWSFSSWRAAGSFGDWSGGGLRLRPGGKGPSAVDDADGGSMCRTERAVVEKQARGREGASGGAGARSSRAGGRAPAEEQAHGAAGWGGRAPAEEQVREVAVLAGSGHAPPCPSPLPPPTTSSPSGPSRFTCGAARFASSAGFLSPLRAGRHWPPPRLSPPVSSLFRAAASLARQPLRLAFSSHAPSPWPPLPCRQRAPRVRGDGGMADPSEVAVGPRRRRRSGVAGVRGRKRNGEADHGSGEREILRIFKG